MNNLVLCRNTNSLKLHILYIYFSDLICKVFNFSVNQEMERLPTGMLCDYAVSLGGMSQGTQDRETSAHSPHAVYGYRQPYHMAPFENWSGLYLGSISVFCLSYCWCGKLLQNLSRLLTRNLPISRVSVTHGHFIVICFPANIVLHWNSSYPSLVFISGCINRLQSYPLSAFNHILSQLSFCSTN